MIDLSVCIVTHNAKSLLLACLESVYSAAGQINLEVILVDNASTDGSVEAVSTQFSDVQILENVENLGFVKPTNQAMMVSQGRYVLWLNNDTVILDNALIRMVEFMDTHLYVGICGPKVMNRDGTIQNQCRRGFPTPWTALTYFTGLSRVFPKSPRFSRYLMTYFDEDQVHEVDAVSGACLLVRRGVVDQIGYLDEDYYAYGEDLDYCARAQNAGWKIYYYPKAKILHYGGQGGSGVRPYRSIYHFYRSMWLFYQKHIAHDYFFLFNWAIGLAIAVKFSLTVAANLFRRRKVIGSAKP